MKIKVLVIDDSAVVRQTMTQILSSDPEIEVIGTASDPVFAAKKIQLERPDVITLDVEMPRMDGLTFLRRINSLEQPIPVVICSSKVEQGSQNELKAIEYGAAELILKPEIGTRSFLTESKIRICDSVKAAYCTRNNRIVKQLREFVPVYVACGGTEIDGLDYVLARKIFRKFQVEQKFDADVMLKKANFQIALETTEKIVVVGASTGGTEALRVFLEMLPVDAPGMVIVQHMPEHFTRSFAQRLDGLCKVNVKEAQNGDSVVRGRVLIAPGNMHTLLKRSGARYFVEVKGGPLVSRHRPSVDVLFRSASRFAGKNAVGVIMTGMGDDGAKGIKELFDSGAWTIAQNEETCIVYGMPCEAVKTGGVKEILPLEKIAPAVMAAIGQKM